MSTDTIVFSLLAAGAGVFVVFRVIPSYLRHRKSEAEAERKRAEERTKRADAERKERDRREVLRNRDPDVDPILRSLICAKLDLQRVLGRIDEFDLTPENMVKLGKWTQDHQDVMAFHVFREITEHFPQPDEEEPVLLKDEIEQLLDEHCDAPTCLGYADEKLGIQRGYEYWDGQNCGGVDYERADGRYEDVNDRFERILRKLPGTDRGYVYILSNRSLPGLVKIGKTHRDPEARAAELSDLSGVPTPFAVAYKIIVSNCGLVETIVHQRLSAHRVADNREFFSTSVQGAATLIEQVSREMEQ